MMETPKSQGQSINEREKVSTVHDEALISKPDTWGSGFKKLYLVCGLVYLCSTMNGYDGSLMGSINAIPEYQDYYGLGPDGSTATGIVFSIYQIGQMVSAFFLWICDWQGRRIPIFAGCFGVIISTIITSTATNLQVFIGGRFLLSFTAMITHATASVYLVEIAHPLIRGTVAGIYNTLYYLGSILATFTIYGANLHLSGNLKWRLPLWLQMVFPGIVCLGVLFIPESPRWLIAKDRHEAARQIITEYHANGNASDPIIDLEIAEIQASLTEQGMTSVKSYFDLRILFSSPARRYRVMLAIVFGWFGQFSGNNIASYYLPSMLNNVGIVETNFVLLMNAIYAVIGWIFAVSGARFHDLWGRRKMLLGSCGGMVVCLAIVAGTAAEYENSGSVTASQASIAFIFIFGAVFAFSFTPMQPIYPAEVLSNDMRAKGMMTFTLSVGCAGFVNTFAAPVALAEIKYWFYVFFVFWDVFEFVFIYFFFVETAGRTLEELDAVFEAKNPRKASTRKRLQHETG